MPWESEEVEEKPGRDWAKHLWIGVAVLVAVGVIAMFLPKSKGANSGITRARVSHILVKFDSKDAGTRRAAIEKIKDIRQRIIDGASFAKMAGEYSDDRGTASKGGDLGWVQRGELAGPIDKYVWSAPLNEVSEPFVAEIGLHIVIVRDREIAAADRYEAEIKERVLKGQGATGASAP